MGVPGAKDKIVTIVGISGTGLYCGGNNIGGKKKSIVLRKQMEKTIISLHKHLPNTKLVWSQILPRRKYRGKIPTFELEEVRKRINNRLATVVLRTGGNYIRYPELSLKNRDFLRMTESISHY